MVSHGLWRRELGAESSAVGRTVRINGHPFTVIGVAPEGFSGVVGVVATDVWAPLAMQPQIAPRETLTERTLVWLELFGRLAPGTSAAQAEAALNARAGEINAAAGRRSGGGIALGAVGALPGHVRTPVRGFLAVLMGIVTLVLLITCVNVAGMLLTRGALRRREIAVRLALGAGRRRLVRQLLTESVLLFTLGGGLGLLLAGWIGRLLLAIDLPLPAAVNLDFGLDPRVLGFTLLVTLLTGISFGLAPALQATRPALVPALKDAAARDGGHRLRLRSVLVVGQVAVSLLLLVAAGLFLRALGVAAAIDPGFKPEGVHLATMDLSLRGYDEPAGRTFFATLRTRLASVPGVEAAGLGRVVPLGLSNSTTGFTVAGHAPPPDGSFPADVNTVSPGYFRTMGIPLVAGRAFDDRDRPTSAPAVIINQALAERFWPAGRAVGQRLSVGENELEVVGVAADAKYRTLGEAPRFYLYYPLAQRYAPRLTLHFRVADALPPAAAGEVARAVRAQIHALDPDLPVVEEMPLIEAISWSLLPQRLASGISGTFGVLGLLLAGLGVYGVTAFAAAQRTRELGVRMALGARAGDVLRLVLGQGLRLTALGAALGLGSALLLTRLLHSLLYGVRATDPLVLVGTALLLGAVALVASLVPALRAAAIDPLKALHYE